MKTLVRLSVSSAIASAVLLGAFATFDDADAAPRRRMMRGTDTGVAQTLHSIRRERGLNCLVDHFHVGNSAGMRTKKTAEAAAISDWASFTAWEYGTLWGNFRVAANKTVSCEPSGAAWGCSVSARPCRR
ncbi:MAG: hypothetical protein R3D27_02070 [Hyphomicrobiaceae bacterium]